MVRLIASHESLINPDTHAGMPSCTSRCQRRSDEQNYSIRRPAYTFQSEHQINDNLSECEVSQSAGKRRQHSLPHHYRSPPELAREYRSAMSTVFRL